MTPKEKMTLLNKYISDKQLNCKIKDEYHFDHCKREYVDLYILVFGSRIRRQFPYGDYGSEEHITFTEINEIQKILNTTNISFSLVKDNDFSIKLALRLY